MPRRFLPLTARQLAGGPRQVVATLGPASLDHASAVADAGVSAFRLNASHLGDTLLGEVVAQIRSEQPGVPVVVDLQGAKMRLGRFAPRQVEAGERLRFSLQGDEHAIPLPHPELFQVVRPGETLHCDDDRLRLQVTAVEGADRLETIALGAGSLLPRKGINRGQHPIELEDLCAHDQACLEALRGVPGLAWAISFMADGREAEWLRRRVPGAIVVGKVERAEALASLAAIDAQVDAIWICRGDLGAQLGPAALARAVAALDPLAWRSPALMAGQVLEHLTLGAEPTRSEVCHLHDLLARGYSGIVLSDETAMGRDPVAAARIARELCDELGGVG